MMYTGVIQWDISSFYVINSISNPLLDLFMVAITHLGSIFFISILGLVILLIAKNENIKKIAVLILMGLAIHAMLITLIKVAVNRERPSEALNDVSLKVWGYEAKAHGASFPSGHAGRWFIIATILIPSRRRLRKFSYFSIAIGILVSISRIYVGMHFPLDVIFGVGFGFLAGYLTLKLEERFEPQIQNLCLKLPFFGSDNKSFL
ncbi:MAG: phosphatase PAP2 family protein [Methanophagales archaeon]|nr:phosphatase PAP2 family protein [Methanophagales archaeon]